MIKIRIWTLKYAFVTALAVLAISFLVQFSNVPNGLDNLSTIYTVIVIGAIIFTVIDYKRYSGGFITFKQVLKISLIITLLGSMAGAGYIDYVLHTIRTEELSATILLLKNQLVESGFKSNEVNQTVEIINQNSVSFLFTGIVFSMMLNIMMLTPMIGIMLRKSPTNPNNGDYPNF